MKSLNNLVKNTNPETNSEDDNNQTSTDPNLQADTTVRKPLPKPHIQS